MNARLDELFDSGRLVRPDGNHPTLVDLVRALGILCGVPDLAPAAAAAAATRVVIDLLGPAEHYVFVLLDGLGMNIVERLPRESFLASNVRRELRATCPSTTACALTSVATADYPARHGVTGWFTHLPSLGITMATLPFTERITGEPLSKRGLRVEDVLPLPPILPRMTHAPMTVAPTYISDTPYNNYARGGTPSAGYASIPEAIGRITDRVREATGPTYTHLYLPEIDTICHKRGVGHADVVPLVLHIDAELARLAAAVAGRAKIVVSADHGLIDVPRERQTLLLRGDPLLDLLVVPPTGDARMPIFHVAEGQRDALRERFHERFGSQMLLIETAEAERRHLFGPGELSPLCRRRFGDFVAIPFVPATLAYHPPNKPIGELFQAVHAGLSPEEMRVPLCVA